MRVRAAARRFNNTPCVDAYTGEYAFSGQFGLYDDTKRDSEAAERRVLSVAPEVVVPSRRVVESAGSKWIMGHSNPDTFKGEVIRLGYVVHEATHLATVSTLVQLCANTAGTQAYAGRAWLKDLGYSEQGSALFTQYHIHFASTETVSAGYIVLFDGDYHVVRSTNKGAGGTLVTHCERMVSPIESAVVQGSTWDPVTETWSGGNSTVRMIRMRWQTLFAYGNADAPTFGPEDAQLAVSKTLLTPKVGMRLTLSDGQWQIASFTDVGVWLCRAVRHG